MTKLISPFDSSPNFNCEFVPGSCVLKRDTNVDVSGTINGPSQNGKDDDHGTLDTLDGWINGNPSYTGVTGISMTWNGISEQYDFEVDT